MEFPFFAKNKTFRPKKKFEQGTMRFNLHKKAQASLNSGLDLKVVVKLPAEEDFNDWLAVHVVDFFNRINLIYGTVCEFCSAETCPIMSGGPRYEYMWMDGEKYRKPTALPATDYINNLMDWVEQLINNETIFPINTGDKTNYHFLGDLDVYGIFPQLRFGNDNLSITFTNDVSFPKSFVSTCKKILTRLHRVFIHVYIHHFDKLVEIGAEAHINTCYKHFYFFVTEFNLVDSKELEPLRDMIQKICI